jgi:hypothetical protein
MSANISHVTDQSFEQDVLKSDLRCWWTSGRNGAGRAA